MSSLPPLAQACGRGACRDHTTPPLTRCDDLVCRWPLANNASLPVLSPAPFREVSSSSVRRALWTWARDAKRRSRQFGGSRSGKCGPPARSRPTQKRAARDPQKVEEREEDEHGRDPWKERAEDGRDSWKEEEEEEKEQEEEAEERDEEEDDARHPREQRRGTFRGVSLLRAGSYYEHVKISAPNEFDVMFKLKVPRIQLEEYSNSGAYYFVKFKRNPQENPLSQFVEGEFLSASKMLSEFRKIIKQEIKNIKDVAMERKKLGSPAVTLLIGESEEISVDIILALEPEGSWPARTKDGLPVKKWLGGKVRTELRQQPFYLVPKHAKEGQSFQEETWRLSFSHIEKYILSHHGDSKKCCEADGVKCCRKDCLKLMKYLLEQLKKKFNRQELSEFCSYHMKTAFFHLCSKYPLDSDWDPKDLRLCFDNCVAFFLERLRKEELEHYFIPGVNFFSQEYIDTKCKEFLAEKIEYERNNGFPIFGEF
ncbi:cyclic GMP-AMP synthase [Fukomys damarensis]|uniref:cyclic GMP-AMP synthase n=1 Tax=Fukomys damarensis TaxID=885580 RepID=UPI00053FA54F|nr:cyclic GMP-AMP synthase [Fukomys damarensis]